MSVDCADEHPTTPYSRLLEQKWLGHLTWAHYRWSLNGGHRQGADDTCNLACMRMSHWVGSSPTSGWDPLQPHCRLGWASNLEYGATSDWSQLYNPRVSTSTSKMINEKTHPQQP